MKFAGLLEGKGWDRGCWRVKFAAVCGSLKRLMGIRLRSRLKAGE